MPNSPAKQDFPRVLAIIQARMGSTRLPHKIMLDLAGRSWRTSSNACAAAG